MKKTLLKEVYKLEQGQTQKCSNCGRINYYTKDELKEAFPFSRERLLCNYCGHTLSVCSLD